MQAIFIKVHIHPPTHTHTVLCFQQQHKLCVRDEAKQRLRQSWLCRADCSRKWNQHNCTVGTDRPFAFSQFSAQNPSSITPQVAKPNRSWNNAFESQLQIRRCLLYSREKLAWKANTVFAASGTSRGKYYTRWPTLCWATITCGMR